MLDLGVVAALPHALSIAIEAELPRYNVYPSVWYIAACVDTIQQEEGHTTRREAKVSYGKPTRRKRHQLVKLLGQIPLHAIRSPSRVEAALGVLGAAEILDFGAPLDQGGDGDDGKVFGGERSPFLAAIEDVFARVLRIFFSTLWIEFGRFGEVRWVLLCFVLLGN